jgi:hypothetical protein
MERFDVSPIKINHLAFKLSKSGALDEITKQAGILFSKDVVKVCTQILRNKNFTLQAGVNQ